MGFRRRRAAATTRLLSRGVALDPRVAVHPGHLGRVRIVEVRSKMEAGHRRVLGGGGALARLNVMMQPRLGVALSRRR